jgi:hypothetical protein
VGIWDGEAFRRLMPDLHEEYFVENKDARLRLLPRFSTALVTRYLLLHIFIDNSSVLGLNVCLLKETQTTRI